MKDKRFSKKKVPGILLVISFVPYLLLLLLGIYSAIDGFTFLFSTSYGWDGFTSSILIYGLLFSTVIPILPLCLLYQIGYLIYRLIRRRTVHGGKWFALVFGGIILVILCGLLLAFHGSALEDFVQKCQAKSMARRADAEISYNEFCLTGGGIFGIEKYRSSQVLVDYDAREVGILMNSGLPEYQRIRLEKGKTSVSVEELFGDRYQLQAVIPLPSPGKVLKTYAPATDQSFHTCALMLEMEDGRVFFADETVMDHDGYYPCTFLNRSVYSVTDTE